MESKDLVYKNEKYIFNNGVYFCEKLNFDENNKPSIKTLKLLDEDIIKINNKFYIVGYRKSYGSKKKNKKSVIIDNDNENDNDNDNEKSENEKSENEKSENENDNENEKSEVKENKPVKKVKKVKNKKSNKKLEN
jgi:hypothetical protein